MTTIPTLALALLDATNATVDADARAAAFPRTLLAFALKGDHATDPGAIVLRDLGPDAAQRFVTHLRVDHPTQPRPGYSSGHYFDALDEAVADYRDRCKRNAAFAA